MIKLDTDGLDCRILRSELELLSQLKPILFFEYDPYLFRKYNDDGFEIFQDLLSIGYRSAIVYQNTGEYLLTARLEDRPLIEDIHKFYSWQAGRRYADICAFHEEDFDLCQKVRSGELDFFHERRRSGS